MAVTLPTVDDFTETTVLTMIRKVVDYLCSDSGLVAQINDNDITGFTSSYTNNLLKIDATKGDGTKIPVCSLTIEGGSSTGNPYPTGITGTVGADGNITFTVTMSSGSPLTTTINMNYFASAEDLSDLQEQVTKLKLTSSGNTMSINGTNAPIVNSISGSVSNGNLKISVNGITSADIPLPESENTFNDVSILTKATTNITYTLQTIGNTTFGVGSIGQNVRPSLYDTENYYRSTSTDNGLFVESGSLNGRLIKATLNLESINRCFNGLSNLGDGVYLVTYYVRGKINIVNISPFPSIARISVSNNVVSVLESTDTCYYLISTTVTGTLTIEGIDIISVMLLRA